MQLLVKKLSLPMFQTHQSQSEKISFKLFIQKATPVGTLLLMIKQIKSYDKKNDFSAFHLKINSLQYHFH